jgi:hypothetical protein
MLVGNSLRYLKRLGHRLAEYLYDPATGRREIRTERVSYEIDLSLRAAVTFP